MSHNSQQVRFVRVRNPDLMKMVLAMPGVERLDGFVLPKVTRTVLSKYLQLLRGRDHLIMPTLETRDVFDEREMMALRKLLERDAVRERILSLRIGGNDLLSLLGMRRPRGRTLYQTPLGLVISRLVTTFKPSGFNLSAPVFEYLDDMETLVREVNEDLAHGLVGKTAVHPDQVPIIEACYRVQASDLEMANQILREDASAVFRMHDSMCEPATHYNWAHRLRKSASCFGLRDGEHADANTLNWLGSG
jgi:citrate lyase beta subunit